MKPCFFGSDMNKAPQIVIVFRCETYDKFRPSEWGAENFGADGFRTTLFSCPFGSDLHFEPMVWPGNDDPYLSLRTTRLSRQIGHADATSGNVKYIALKKPNTV